MLRIWNSRSASSAALLNDPTGGAVNSGLARGGARAFCFRGFKLYGGNGKVTGCLVVSASGGAAHACGFRARQG